MPCRTTLTTPAWSTRASGPGQAVQHHVVRDRLYRGPCRTPAEFQTFFEKFNELKPKVMEIFDTVPGMDTGYRKDAQKYLEGFYSTISKPGDVKKAFIDECNNRAGM